MKRYKLKRDLPTFKAGEIFYLNDAGSLIHKGDGVAAYSWATIDKFPNILTDWFDEIEEPTRWKPEGGERYYYVGNTGNTFGSEWSYFVLDQDRFEIGNCFKTEEEAERVVEYLKALAVVRGDATTEFTRGKSNWFVYLDADHNSLHPTCSYYINSKGVFGLPYFATEKDAQRSIELHRNEWLTIFGIEEEK